MNDLRAAEDGTAQSLREEWRTHDDAVVDAQLLIRDLEDLVDRRTQLASPLTSLYGAKTEEILPRTGMPPISIDEIWQVVFKNITADSKRPVYVRRSGTCLACYIG